eukprot:c6723_g1_i1.p1 GENE.c6723_g1_i1~~c6723_g1_i1.p1  ORF type:complete len:261 (-),score=50.16 c6723_g1_i1:265-972(-)
MTHEEKPGLWLNDKANLFVFIITTIGFAFAGLGLALVPVGEDSNYRTSLSFFNPSDNGGMDLLDMHLLVPLENFPLFWVGIIWPFVAAVVTLGGSYYKSRPILLYALLFVGVSASLLLLCSHLLTVFTYNCRFCDSATLPDGVVDKTPGDTSDNCPSYGRTVAINVHGLNYTYGEYNFKSACTAGHALYVLGSAIMLLSMYLFMITIERRRTIIHSGYDVFGEIYDNSVSSRSVS